jgi:hypothetical protein
MKYPTAFSLFWVEKPSNVQPCRILIINEKTITITITTHVSEDHREAAEKNKHIFIQVLCNSLFRPRQWRSYLSTHCPRRSTEARKLKIMFHDDK